jgi:lipopolysaccharide transport protein LptA
LSWLLVVALAAAPAPRDGGVLSQATLIHPVHIRSEHLEILGRDRAAIYSGHAVAVRDATTIRCDRLVVRYRHEPGREVEVASIEAEGGVEVEDGDRRASGEKAEFDNETGRLVVTGSPRARQGGTHVSGSRVTFTSGQDVIDIDDARTVLEEQPKGVALREGELRIASERLQILSRQHQAIWSGKVKAERGPAKISGQKLVAHYGAKQEVERLVATGGVVVEEGDRWARGERADFDNGSGVLVVTGNPQARQGPNQMRGKKVTFTLGDERVRVDGADVTVFPGKLPRGGTP